MIHRLQNAQQLAVYADDVQRGIADIIREARLTTKTVEQVYGELEEHVRGQDTEGLWFVLVDAKLIAWIAAKIYFDCGRKTGAVTWAWASPKAAGASADVLKVVERWAQAHGAPAIYATRRTRLKAWDRLLRRYGWAFEAVVYAKTLEPDKLGTEAPTAQEEPRGAEARQSRPQRAEHAARLQPPPADGGRPAPPRPHRPDGRAAEHGD